MLQIIVPERELFDEKTNEFILLREQKLKLEHSLLSLSKWESRWHKPFLNSEGHTREEMNDYYYCMSLDGNVKRNFFDYLPNDIINKIEEYIQDPMTATTFSESGSGKSSETMTSEVLYYYMVRLAIPFECEKWHLNRLMTLIRVYDAKSSTKKKSARQVMSENMALNAARKAKVGSRG